ncbi:MULTISPECIES: substrate-binding domain-containing protein [unclassified Fusibacter]|uniref:substrate-binding domain-containing protein n=1 Tax=unclassified Fusibacter TaxID=2624464 RepID=UPI001013385E|nr:MULTISPECIES: substrate-binding domain-containing protein [unclassified Fusibacter]MCK8060769.1 substrate-binding domain-containing protein [Fusibacter sp. A2]NPE23065.1 substrate-binding domain-containing protein [Fusibacter sp. A1]RXV59737.1 D-ribose ABC transporter substrate-binding protein [Fusibacter sp. A1]
MILRKIRHIRSLCLLVLIAILTVGCVGSQTKTVSIGVVLSNLNNPFFESIQNGMMDSTGSSELKLTIVSSDDEINKEYEAVKMLIYQGVDLIVINPTNSDAVFRAVSLANESGIPVMTVDRESTGGRIVSHIGSDNRSGGEMIAKVMIEGAGNQGKYAEIIGVEGTSASKLRGEGFNYYMSANSYMTLAAAVPADFDREKGRLSMQTILSVHPDLVAVFAQNDEMALGALSAVESAGLPIKIYGFDGSDEAIRAIDEGLLEATVAQQPYLIGKMTVEAAKAFLDGSDVEELILVPVRIITKKE